MADFTTVMTDTTALDNSIIEEFDSQFLVAFGETNSVDQFANIKKSIGSKQISIPIYDLLSPVTSALTEKEDPASVALSDTEVTLTPAEYGNAVTTTKLANFQTGGMADMAAARMIGINAAQSLSKHFFAAADLSTNIYRVNARAADVNIVAGDVMDATTLGIAYNKLARSSVPYLTGGEYVLIAHDDVIHDLREGTSAGTWQDTHKYALPGELLKNEVGMFKGFRVIRNNLATIDADAGAGGTVDVYYSYALGFNGIGKAVSMDLDTRITGPFDKLARFLNIGWYGVHQYKIVQSQACWVLRSSSSLGANT